MNKSINAITLEYMMNPKIYDMYISNKGKDEINKSDVKFYRKRIIALTKDMFSTKNTHTNTINLAFNEYIKECIEYLRFQDKFDLLQEEFADISYNSPIDNSEPDLETATRQIFKQPPKVNTLDKFVKVTKADVEEMHIPQQKELDLDNPKLKRKGLKDKKKSK